MKWDRIRSTLERVDHALDRAIADAEIPGAVVLARMPGEGESVEYASARGHAVLHPERVPMTRETIFDLASLTKPLATTTAVLLLASDGAIGLDDPVAAFLPDFAAGGKAKVTIRHLLTHSSGLESWRAFHEVVTDKERQGFARIAGTAAAKSLVLDCILRSGLVHEPGTKAAYGDLDFIVLGAVVETVTGRPLDEFCQARIFHPLGLQQTSFVRLGEGAQALPERARRQFAATEDCPWRGRILWGEVHDPNASVMGGVAGHAGLFAPADDVMRFATVVLDVYHQRSDALPGGLLRSFLTRQNLPESSEWALGWGTPTEGGSSGRYFSANSVGHLGFTGTSLWIDIEREVVVVMLTNRVHPVVKHSRFELRPIVHNLLLEAFLAE